MSNIILAKVVFFMTFYATAGEVICEGIIKDKPNSIKFVSLKGKRIGTLKVLRNAEMIRVDVSESFTTDYEIKNNEKYQEFNRNSCIGDI